MGFQRVMDAQSLFNENPRIAELQDERNKCKRKLVQLEESVSAEELLNAVQDPDSVLEDKQFGDKDILGEIISQNKKFRLSASVVAQSLHDTASGDTPDISSDSDADE